MSEPITTAERYLADPRVVKLRNTGRPWCAPRSVENVVVQLAQRAERGAINPKFVFTQLTAAALDIPPELRAEVLDEAARILTAERLAAEGATR